MTALPPAPPGQGCYAEIRNIDADKLVKVPKEIPNDVAAAMMLQGNDCPVSDPAGL